MTPGPSDLLDPAMPAPTQPQVALRLSLLREHGEGWGGGWQFLG